MAHVSQKLSNAFQGALATVVMVAVMYRLVMRWVVEGAGMAELSRRFKMSTRLPEAGCTN
jgi:hypothetical protein